MIYSQICLQISSVATVFKKLKDLFKKKKKPKPKQEKIEISSEEYATYKDIVNLLDEFEYDIPALNHLLNIAKERAES